MFLIFIYIINYLYIVFINICKSSIRFSIGSILRNVAIDNISISLAYGEFKIHACK